MLVIITWNRCWKVKGQMDQSYKSMALDHCLEHLEHEGQRSKYRLLVKVKGQRSIGLYYSLEHRYQKVKGQYEMFLQRSNSDPFWNWRSTFRKGQMLRIITWKIFIRSKVKRMKLDDFQGQCWCLCRVIWDKNFLNNNNVFL